MPRSTHSYLFEMKVSKFAYKLSETLSGDIKAFLMVLGEDGAVIYLIFQSPTSSWHDFIKQLESSNQPYFFYDPFDLPEYFWLSWHKINQPIMERLMGETFESKDFVDFKSSLPKAENLKSAITYPETWDVMF